MTRSPLEVFLAFLRLGLTSFGGPAAHLGYFRAEFVERRRWLDDAALGECIAVSQLLPGPASSQTGMLIGWLSCGPLGAVAAWLGFTTPSAVAMAAIAMELPRFAVANRVHALLLVAAAVVLSAVVTMRATLAPDIVRGAFAAATFAAVLEVPAPWIGPLAIAAAAILATILLQGRVPAKVSALDLHVSKRAGAIALGGFVATLAALSVAARWSHVPLLVLADECFRIGSLVFGGGHVVLPLMQSQLASSGIVDANTILTGYAAAQAMPGPLFTIASFAGAAAFGGTLGWLGAVVATIAIFTPSFFLLTSIAPFYASLARNARFRAAIAGANASVVGLLGAALVNPILTSSLRAWSDALLVAIAFVAVHFARIPAWTLVLVAAIAGMIR